MGRSEELKGQQLLDYMCILGRCYTYSLLLVHALTEGKNDVTNDSFYTELDRLIKTISKQKIIMIFENFNVNLGKEEPFKPTIRKHTLHEISNNNACDSSI